MKTKSSAAFALVVILSASASVTACRKATIGEKIDDALDNRPFEEVRDGAEDAKEKVKKAVE